MNLGSGHRLDAAEDVGDGDDMQICLYAHGCVDAGERAGERPGIEVDRRVSAAGRAAVVPRIEAARNG